MKQVLDDNPTNYLVLKEDGSTEIYSKDSDLNQLLFEYNLHGLLREGDEIWNSGTMDGPTVEVIPDGKDAYRLRINEDGFENLFLSRHRKKDLIATLAEAYDQNHSEPFISLYESIRENLTRPFVLGHFAEALSSHIEKRQNGWFINGRLMLTYDCEFFHPQTESTKRSGGSVVEAGSNTNAYSLSINDLDKVKRSVFIDDIEYYLTDSEAEFLAKAMWAIQKT